LEAVKDLSAKWPHALAKLIEDKANGPAVIQSLQGRIAGLIPVDPSGTKEARAHAVSPQIEAGNVYLPHPSIAPWVADLLAECAAFPNGTYADQVDTLTQALLRLELGWQTEELVVYDERVEISPY
jgi:predicted phage terminase large subunit-like protein